MGLRLSVMEQGMGENLLMQETEKQLLPNCVANTWSQELSPRPSHFHAMGPSLSTNDGTKQPGGKGADAELKSEDTFCL